MDQLSVGMSWCHQLFCNRGNLGMIAPPLCTMLLTTLTVISLLSFTKIQQPLKVEFVNQVSSEIYSKHLRYEPVCQEDHLLEEKSLVYGAQFTRELFVCCQDCRRTNPPLTRRLSGKCLAACTNALVKAVRLPYLLDLINTIRPWDMHVAFSRGGLEDMTMVSPKAPPPPTVQSFGRDSKDGDVLSKTTSPDSGMLILGVGSCHSLGSLPKNTPAKSCTELLAFG